MSEQFPIAANDNNPPEDFAEAVPIIDFDQVLFTVGLSSKILENETIKKIVKNIKDDGNPADFFENPYDFELFSNLLVIYQKRCFAGNTHLTEDDVETAVQAIKFEMARREPLA